MRPLLHPELVNGRFGDPAVYVETMFEKAAALFDLGDISCLPPRKVRRIRRVFVSHAHIDHFIGFDHLLRLLVGRDQRVELYGPEGFADRVRHKLRAYRWNLVDRYASDLVLAVTEVADAGSARTVRFRLKTAFAPEDMGSRTLVDGTIHSGPAFQVKAAVLDHATPCLGFAIREETHVNVWKNRLAALGLPVGPWLRELKRAVIAGRPDAHLVPVGPAGSGRRMALGALRDAVTVTPGQKVVYVTDVADTAANRRAIVDLARDADFLFIEAAFTAADSALAAERAHLTTVAAGELARAAGVRRVEPFHFSPRYEGEEERLLAEVMAAFRGGPCV